MTPERLKVAKAVANKYSCPVQCDGETVYPDAPVTVAVNDHGLGDNTPRRYATPSGEGTKL
jgi:hypothetical protein